MGAAAVVATLLVIDVATLAGSRGGASRPQGFSATPSPFVEPSGVGGTGPDIGPVRDVSAVRDGALASSEMSSSGPGAVSTPSPASSPRAATAAVAGPGGPGAPVVVDPSTAWAVVVGIGTYDSPTHPTFGGIGDVAAFHRLLTQAGWSESHILTLTDQAASADGIRSAMHWLVTHSSPSSFSVFHYSGHVNQTSGRDSLWGVDNNFIGSDEFGSDLGGLQGRAWIDVSGCEASAFDHGLSSPSRFFTASSMADQKSYEMPAWRESVWTGLVVDQGMLQHAAGAGPISIQQAVRWAQPRAFNETSRQQPYGPQQPYARGGDGEWFLGPSVAPATGPPAPTHPVVPGTTPPVSAAPASKDGCAALTAGLLHCGS